MTWPCLEFGTNSKPKAQLTKAAGAVFSYCSGHRLNATSIPLSELIVHLVGATHAVYGYNSHPIINSLILYI